MTLDEASSEELIALKKKLSDLEKGTLSNVSTSDSLKESLMENNKQLASALSLLTDRIKELEEKLQKAHQEKPHEENVSQSIPQADYDYQHAWIIRIICILGLGIILSFLRLRLKNIDGTVAKHD